jgi:hypothetical protein
MTRSSTIASKPPWKGAIISATSAGGTAAIGCGIAAASVDGVAASARVTMGG